MRRYQLLLSLTIVLGLSFFRMPAAYAGTGEDAGYIMRGTGKLLGSAFAIPKAMLEDSGRVMFPFGIVTGAVRGTVQMVSGIFGGAADVATGSAPYAKYAALAL